MVAQMKSFSLSPPREEGCSALVHRCLPSLDFLSMSLFAALSRLQSEQTFLHLIMVLPHCPAVFKTRSNLCLADSSKGPWGRRLYYAVASSR